MTKELERLRNKAQADSTRDAKALMILNLNSFNPLYVVRNFHPCVLVGGSRAAGELVEIIKPEGRKEFNQTFKMDDGVAIDCQAFLSDENHWRIQAWNLDKKFFVEFSTRQIEKVSGMIKTEYKKCC